MKNDIVNKMASWSEITELTDLDECFSMQEITHKTLDYLLEEALETKAACDAEDMPELLDGFADTAFVAINGIYKTFRVLGNTPEQALDKTKVVLRRVIDANWAKLDFNGNVLKNEQGKVIKPAGWEEPNYDDLL